MKKKAALILTVFLLSACGAPQVVELNPATDLNPGESIPQAEAAASVTPAQEESRAIEAAPEDYGITFINLSGKDLKELSISFPNGVYGPKQILSQRLPDGDSLSYRDPQLALINSPARLKLSVTALAVDGSELSFPELVLYDMTDSTVILGFEQGEYISEL